ncbi:YeiH family protein [Desulfurivibrio sp. D14AmB]|uniref:YeiH family protein n=1 Tax=Desulfurivibrio sp. D14AmB TaxID=3374370 RepID=UPI00376F3486
MTAPTNSDVVVDKGKWEWSEMWKKEDWWAIWLGFAILAVGLMIFLPRPPAEMHEKLTRAENTLSAEAARATFQTIEWHLANDAKSGLRARNEPYAKSIGQWLQRPGRWSSNPLESLYLSEEAAAARRAAALPAYEEAQEKTKAALANAKTAQAMAEAAGFQSTALNDQAETAISEWRQAREKERGSLRSRATVQAYNKIPYLIGALVITMLIFSIGTRFMGISTAKFIQGFWFVFLLAVVAEIIGNQTTMREYGFGAIIWAILGGMLISNTVGTPAFLKAALQTEYFIKTGLVLLGAEILFGKMLAIGLPGIFVAWVVTPTVLILTYILGQKVIGLQSKTLNITVSADMSVCGVSAAIATAAACRAKKEELTIAIGMSMLFTAVMMIALPTFIVAVGMHPVLGGAWIGGTIDSTGAVVAAGAFLGETGMFVAATIKMIQNVMIGIIAFGVAVYWCARVDCVQGQTVSKMEIWYRFPKFVLGFISASIIFSAMLAYMGSVGDVMIDQGVLRGFSRPLRDWFFILAFASIGLSSNFREMAAHFKGGKPAILYVCGQSLNVALTLLMAYIMFFLVFPGVTESLMQ